MENENHERDKALDMALAQIDKQFGKGSIMRLGEHGNVGVAAISTGALSLDLALGVGGVPRGRIVEIFGQPPAHLAAGRAHFALRVSRRPGQTRASSRRRIRRALKR